MFKINDPNLILKLFKENIDNAKFTPLKPSFYAVSNEIVSGFKIVLDKEHIEAWQSDDKENEVIQCEVSFEE